MKCLTNDYIKENKNDDHWCKRMTLKNGQSLSVQAGKYNYCSPRRSGEDHYYEVEVGFPSEAIESIMIYAEQPEYPTGTVYGYVPVELINEYILKSGGFA